MRLLDKLNSNPRQTFSVLAEDGSTVTFSFVYLPSQQCWTVDVLRNDFAVKGIQLQVNPNILRNYRNVIPFGLSVTSEDGYDPYYLDDFDTQRIQVYLMSAADVEDFEREFFR